MKFFVPLTALFCAATVTAAPLVSTLNRKYQMVLQTRTSKKLIIHLDVQVRSSVVSSYVESKSTGLRCRGCSQLTLLVSRHTYEDTPDDEDCDCDEEK